MIDTDKYEARIISLGSLTAIEASSLGDRICFFCVRKHDDGTGMVIACPMRMSDIVYLLNSPRDEDSRRKYFVDEAEADAYLKRWEASQ